MHSKFLAIILSAYFCLASVSASADTTISFEDLSDSDFVGSHYNGVTFSNAIVLTAGVSLNEFDFPPYSGTNVISDVSGPISISFQDAVSSISGYFTYVGTLSFSAYDKNNLFLGSANSIFNNNTALTGDSGSHANELISLSINNTPIYKVTISGDPAGSSFVADDIIYKPISPVPEPKVYAMLIAGLMLFGVMARGRLS